MIPVGASCGFTGIETFLLAVLTAFVACVGSIMALTRRFSLKDDCLLRHKGEQDIKEKLQKVIVSQRIQFMMLRAIIIHLDLPPDTKEKILNMTAVKGDEE